MRGSILTLFIHRVSMLNIFFSLNPLGPPFSKNNNNVPSSLWYMFDFSSRPHCYLRIDSISKRPLRIEKICRGKTMEFNSCARYL